MSAEEGTSATRAPDVTAHATQLFRDGRWDECLAAIEAALGAEVGEAAVRRLQILRVRVLGFSLNRPAYALYVLGSLEGRLADDPTLRLLKARIEERLGHHVAAFAGYKTLFRQNQSADALRSMYALLIRQNRWSSARGLETLITLGEDFGADLNLVQRALVQRDCKRANAVLAVAQTAYGDRSTDPRFVRRERLCRTLEAELANSDSMRGARHVAVAGTADAGSTIMGCLIGSLPGWAFAGETGRLVEDGSSEPSLALCRVCGERCECFDLTFRQGLARNRVGWFAQVARRLATNNLVTTEEESRALWSLDPLCRYDLVVLFRSPERYIASVLLAERQSGPVDEGVFKQKVGSLLDAWVTNYRGHLRLLNPTARRVVIDWDSFAAQPRQHWSTLSAILALPRTSQPWKALRLEHFIGGNASDVAAVLGGGRFALHPSTAPSLGAELREEVARHHAAASLHAMLSAHHRQVFGSIGRSWFSRFFGPSRSAATLDQVEEIEDVPE